MPSYYENHRQELLAYKKQYRENKKEMIAEKSKEYYQANKERISAYGKDYREKNRKVIYEKHNCQCGGKYTTNSKSQHSKSLKHKQYMQQQETKSLDE